jgi:hypothetical protein
VQGTSAETKRSKVDWALEVVALLAALGALGLVAVYSPQIPERVVDFGYRYGRPPGLSGIFTPKTVLWMVAAIDAAAYLGLTMGARDHGLFAIPVELERDAPHLRQMLFSMVIVMKTVLALFGVYLVWSLVQVATRQGSGISGQFLTLFTLAVPLPLVFYTVKMRRYKK